MNRSVRESKNIDIVVEGHLGPCSVFQIFVREFWIAKKKKSDKKNCGQTFMKKNYVEKLIKSQETIMNQKY